VKKRVKLFQKSISFLTGLLLVVQSLYPGVLPLVRYAQAQEADPASTETQSQTTTTSQEDSQQDNQSAENSAASGDTGASASVDPNDSTGPTGATGTAGPSVTIDQNDDTGAIGPTGATGETPDIGPTGSTGVTEPDDTNDQVTGEDQQTTQESNGEPPKETGPPGDILDGISVTAIPLPTVTVAPEPEEDGILNAVVIKNVKAETIDLDNVDPSNSASLSTDKADYAPTDTVLITGSGFTAGETYTLIVTSEDEPPVRHEEQVTADESGTFIYAYQLDGNYRPNYKVEAKDINGDIVAIVKFTDSRSIESIKLNGASHTIVSPSATVTVTIQVKTTSNGGNDWLSTRYKIGSGSWQCVDTPDHTSSGTYTESFDVTAPASLGNYDVALRAHEGAGCTGDYNDEDVVDDGIQVKNITSNPSLSSSCGMDLVLILDSSDSMTNNDILDVKDAATTLVNSLMPSTPTRIGVIDFDTTVISSLSPTTDKSNVLNAINSIGHTGALEYTNWDAALLAADGMVGSDALVVIITDGNPTESNGPLSDLDDAIARANAIKASDTRILAIGIDSSGSSGGLDLPNLEAISGPNDVTIPPGTITNINNVDVVLGDISQLGTALANLTTALCGGKVIVTKMIGDQPQPGWTYTLDVTGGTSTPSSDQTGPNGIVQFDVTPGPTGDTATVDVTETVQSGYSVTDANCTNNNQSTGTFDGTDSVDGIVMDNDDIVSCIFINAPPAETIDICHATGSNTNPYVTNSPAKSGDVSGHDDHNGPIWFLGIDVEWGDIIPPFDYPGGHYDGQNWDATGQEIYRIGCNIPTGTIIIVKDTQPDDAQNFSFTGDLGAFTLDDDADGTLSNTQTFNNVAVGTYAVSEAGVSGWTLSNITCVDPTQNSTGNLPAAPTASIDLAGGESVTCTFTNRLNTTDVRITKSDAPDPVVSGGVLTYTLTVNNDSSVSAENVTVTDTLPGEFLTLISVVPSQGSCSDNTLPSPVICELGTIAAAGNATITITGIVVGTGTIENRATVTTTTNELDLQDNQDSEQTEIIDVPSQCVRGERWSTSIMTASQGLRKDGSPVLPLRSIPASVLGTPNATTNPDSGFYSLGQGGSIVVAFANPVVDGMGTDLSFHEITNGRESYPEEKANIEVSTDGGATWHAVGTVSSLAAGGVGYVDIAPYTNVTHVRITDTTNFALNPAGITDGYDLDAVDADCRSTITTYKNLDTDGDGDTDQTHVGGWTWDINGTGNYPMGSTQEVVAGSYTISEDNQTGYHFAQLICEDVTQNGPTPTLEVGVESAVECEYTNAHDTGTIRITKDSQPDSGQNFTFTTTGGLPASFLLDDGSGGPSLPNTRIYTVPTGTFTVTEGTVAGWKLTDLVCNDSNGSVDLTNRTATINLENGETITCTFTNQELGSIEGKKFNDRNGDGDHDLLETRLNGWRIFIDENANQTYDVGEPTDTTSGVFIIFPLGEYEFNNLLPGDYTVCEELQNGWYNSTPICRTTTLTPGDTDTLNFGNHQALTIKTYKVVCEDEAQLPNWGNGGPNITASTAQNYVNTHEGCRLESGWDFQYGFDGQVSKYGNGDQLGLAPVETGWQMLGTTGDGTPAEITVSDVQGASAIWVRESLKPGYVPFSYPPKGPTEDPVSAEIYCNADVNHYDNYDRISDLRYGETYYCVAFNAYNGKVIVTKYNDKNGDKDWDEGEEEVLPNWDIALSGDPKTTDENGQVLYDGLPFGIYYLSESLKEGWYQSGITCDNESEVSPTPTQIPTSNQETDNIFGVQKVNAQEITGHPVTVNSSAPVNCYIGNYNPSLTIEKSNNAGGDKSPGDNVLFTLVVTAGDSFTPDVTVKDLPAGGFNYRPGSWTFNSDINPLLAVGEPSYASPGVWNLGDMVAGEVITLKYLASIGSGVFPGLYKDLAWAKSQPDGDIVMANDLTDPLFFVGTQVNVVRETQNSSSHNVVSTSEVLGASTELPATGANTRWLLFALALMGLGIGAVSVGHLVRRKYA